MGNPVVHFEITGKNAETLHSFYSSLFGWKLQPIPEMGYALVDTDSAGQGIAGGIGTGDDAPSQVTFYIEVPDPQAHLDRAVALGGSVVMPVTGIPGMVTMAQFADPEGHVIGIVKSEQG